MRIASRVVLTLALFAMLLAKAPELRAETTAPLVLAAASLKNVFDQVASDWKSKTGKDVTLVYAASSALAKQIEQGAPADIFASANVAWMNHLTEGGLIKADTRSDLLGNALVLIAPADTTRSFTITKGADLGNFVGNGRLAVAEVTSVPAGRYAKQALTTLDMWPGVEDKLAQGNNVRATLALVARGEAVAGIVYATDAKIEPMVKVLDTFPADSHTPIIYPVAILTASTHPDAEAFLVYLHSAEAARVYVASGFTLIAQSGN